MKYSHDVWDGMDAAFGVERLLPPESNRLHQAPPPRAGDFSFCHVSSALLRPGAFVPPNPSIPCHNN
jgi:hypothetical protein